MLKKKTKSVITFLMLIKFFFSNYQLSNSRHITDYVSISVACIWKHLFETMSYFNTQNPSV